ncbi:MAG: hypothetical protein RBU36_10970 [Thermoanaerobaculia bacterium]|jgi:hypothetical protein|nr:hypothetical protein [Thermoanaerobaculia bacterium]
MKTTKNALLLALALALVATASPAAAQADFSKFVAIGASVDAGFLDNCWVRYGQVDSWNAILARQAGAPAFEQPLLDTPGTGCMYLISLAPQFGTRPAQVKPLNLTLPRPYDNLSIPGYTLQAALTKKGPSSASDVAGLVLRTLNATQVEQAASLKPTFVSIGLFGNEILGPATSGTAVDGVTVMPAAMYAASYQAVVDTLKAAQGGTGKGVAQLIPDITTIPFTSTIPPFITSGGQVVMGPNGQPLTFLSSRGGDATGGGAGVAPIPATSLVNITASAFLATGYGIPCAVLDAGGAPANDPRRTNCNKPLPDNANAQLGLPGVVLYPEEVALLKARGAEFNEQIRAIATAAGYKVFDTTAFFTDLRTHGREYAGITVNAAFLSGGLISYDGVHPTSLGYAVWADEMVRFINANYGTTIPRPDLSAYLFSGSSAQGGYPVNFGAALTTEDAIAWGAAIYTPEVMRTLADTFPVSARTAAAAPETEEAPVPAEPRGRSARIDD